MGCGGSKNQGGVSLEQAGALSRLTVWGDTFNT